MIFKYHISFTDRFHCPFPIQEFCWLCWVKWMHAYWTMNWSWSRSFTVPQAQLESWFASVALVTIKEWNFFKVAGSSQSGSMAHDNFIRISAAWCTDNQAEKLISKEFILRFIKTNSLSCSYKTYSMASLPSDQLLFSMRKQGTSGNRKVWKWALFSGNTIYPDVSLTSVVVKRIWYICCFKEIKSMSYVQYLCQYLIQTAIWGTGYGSNAGYSIRFLSSVK